MIRVGFRDGDRRATEVKVGFGTGVRVGFWMRVGVYFRDVGRVLGWGTVLGFMVGDGSRISGQDTELGFEVRVSPR
ncbi:hypothetical protein TIFTF001_018893 [Ficus carica]|uniref:Uncharacterized protein n=1 Tax=Ficus carica TaxID=3494 RepID=A0AA88D8C2_FICCA|nr:hypothetical protein TIFTF001_018893 [Ficus carica]